MKYVAAFLIVIIAFAPVQGANIVFKKTKIVHTTDDGEKEIQAIVTWSDDHVSITPKSKKERKQYPELTMEIPYTKMFDLEYSNSRHWRVAAALLVSPLTLFSKRKHHYFSFAYEKGEGKRDAMILRVDKKEEKTYRKRIPLITGLELTEHPAE